MQSEIIEKKLITRGIYLGYLFLFTNLISSFVLTPIIVKYLRRSAYGLWVTFGSIMGYFGLFTFGLNIAATKYTAEYRATNSQEILNKVISSYQKIYLWITYTFERRLFRF